MKLETRLEDLRRPVSLCIRDAMCTYGEWPECYPLCPIYARHRVFTASGGGLVCLSSAIVEGRIGYTPTIAEFAYECTLCGACDMCQIIPVPPPHVTPTEVIRLLRRQLVREGMAPEELLERYGKTREARISSLKKEMAAAGRDKAIQADTVLYVEGVDSPRRGSGYGAAGRLLAKMGITPDVVEGPAGVYDLYDLGFWDELSVLLDAESEILKQLAGKDVLFVNPHSQEFFVKHYAEISGEDMEIRGRNFIELLADALDQGRLQPTGDRMKVSYHDPCRLSRGLGIVEEPRKLLDFLGARIVEMKRNKAATYCCGAGGLTGVFPDFSRSVASERLEEFHETGADLLITACPHCAEIFKTVLPAAEKGRVVDILEFADRHTRETSDG